MCLAVWRYQIDKLGDDHDYRELNPHRRPSFADPRPRLTLSSAAFGSSIGPKPKSELGCLRRIRRTSRASVIVPKTRTASVVASGPALRSSAARAARKAEAGMVKIHAQTI